MNAGVAIVGMDRQRHVAIWLRMLAEKEIRLARQTFRLLKMQGNQAKTAFETGGQGAAEQVITESLNPLYRLLTVSYSLTTTDFISYTFDQLGAKKRTFQDIVQGFISKTALEKSRLITGTTMDLMKAAILKGQQDGAGETEIARAIQQSVGGSIAESRSRMIARTEIHNAATYGMQAAAEETQLKMTKEWVAVHDDRTREAHADADGQIVGMDEPFEVDGELIDRPGEGSAENSINCRCTVIYEPVSADVTGDSGGGEFINGD